VRVSEGKLEIVSWDFLYYGFGIFVQMVRCLVRRNRTFYSLDEVSNDWGNFCISFDFFFGIKQIKNNI
jgi:hypothetical protein